MFIFALATFSLINGCTWQTAALLGTTLGGFVVAISIVQQELGISNDLTERLCHAGKNTDCDAVMHSKGSRFAKQLAWADAGIIYFTGYSLLLVTAFYNNSAGSIYLLALLSVATIPFTLFSLYYQWRVVKKWCPLCLMTVAVLWVQFGLTAYVTLSQFTLSNGEGKGDL